MCKKPAIYGNDFLSHILSVLSQYFHLVSIKNDRDIYFPETEPNNIQNIF